MSKSNAIRVKGVQAIKAKFKALGLSAKDSRTEINKALRPAGNLLARRMQRAYKKEFNRFKGTRKQGRTPTWKTIGITTARNSREPGIFVGPMKKRTTPIRVKGKNSYNLAEMQILGNAKQRPRKNVFKETAIQMESIIQARVKKDLNKLLEKMIKKSGLR